MISIQTNRSRSCSILWQTDAGGTEDEEDGFGSDSDANSDASSITGAPKADETAYEGGDILTTVVVEPMSLSRSPTPESIPDLVYHDPDAGATTTTKGSSQPIAVIHKRRIKNKPQMRPKMSREDKKARATGGKKAKKLAEKKGKGTKGRSNK